jgi:hypothetical protein
MCNLFLFRKQRKFQEKQFWEELWEKQILFIGQFKPHNCIQELFKNYQKNGLNIRKMK